MPRLLAPVLTGTLVIALLAAGCGSDEKKPAPSALAGSITVAAAGGEGEVTALQAVADAFELEYPGTTVTLDSVANPGDLVGKLAAAFATRTAPDVFVMNYRRLGAFAAKDVIEPVPVVSTKGQFLNPMTAFTFDGRLLCRPSNASSMVVYLNTDLFAAAELPLPKRTWTWDDLLATAQALRAKGISAIGFEPALVRLAPFVWSNGGEVVDNPDAPTQVDLSSAPAREALQLLLDLQKTGMSATDRAAQDPEEAFSAGKTAMYLDSRRAVPGLRKVTGLGFDVAPIPTKLTSTSVLHSDGYCVSRATKNKALAEAFADYAVTGDGARILAESGRTVPVLRSIAESATFLAPNELPKGSKVFLDQAETSRALPHTPTWHEAESVTEEILTQLFAGKTTLDQAIADIRAATKVALARGLAKG